MVFFKDMFIDMFYLIFDIEDCGDDKDLLISECIYCCCEEWGWIYSM